MATNSSPTSTILGSDPDLESWPDHLELPDKDGSFVKNSQDPLQSMLLTDSLRPWLRRRYPDGRYFIGQDCGIYWKKEGPNLYRAEAPDWFFVADVPPLLDGRLRRSYVLWREAIPPLVIVEYVSGDGTEERDATPDVGKYWVYERVIRPVYYGIYEPAAGRLEVNHLVDGRLVPLPPNEQGRFAIRPLGVELGLWQGSFADVELPWLRWWDDAGNLLLTGEERAEMLAARLRAMGIEP